MNDKQKAVEMRQKCMETYSETDGREEKRGRKRKDNGELLSYLKRKSEMDQELRLRQLELKEKEQAMHEKSQEMMQTMITNNNEFQKNMLQCFSTIVSKLNRNEP